MLDQITPLLLTYNEAPNIGRTLDRLRWARDIVVVDSFSDDGTLEIVSRFPQARLFQRKFDSHDNQWNFALKETGIDSDWVLALDADYVLTRPVLDEIRALKPAPDTTGYRANFTYCIHGRPLRSGVYPPVTVLYRRDRANYSGDGHTHRVAVEGRIESLKHPVLHDDRKPLGRWFRLQQRYAGLEAMKILNSARHDLSWADRLRRLRVAAPPAMLFYVLIWRGGIFDGWAGFYYALQRTLAEVMLSLELLDRDLRSGRKPRTDDEKAITGPRRAVDDTAP